MFLPRGQCQAVTPLFGRTMWSRATNSVSGATAFAEVSTSPFHFCPSVWRCLSSVRFSTIFHDSPVSRKALKSSAT